MTWIRVSDVRQFNFCPRVIWHRSVVGHETPETPKMEHGRRAEVALEKLEKRRALRRYRIDSARRHFNVRLESSELGLSGICDLVLEASPTWYPVEVKTTRGGVGRHHVLQLTGYAILLERARQAVVDTGFVVLLPEDRVVPVRIEQADRDEFQQTVNAIRQMIANERFPRPTRFRSFCPDCEYVNFCGDVL